MARSIVTPSHDDDVTSERRQSVTQHTAQRARRRGGAQHVQVSAHGCTDERSSDDDDRRWWWWANIIIIVIIGFRARWEGCDGGEAVHARVLFRGGMDDDFYGGYIVQQVDLSVFGVRIPGGVDVVAHGFLHDGGDGVGERV